MHPTAHPLTTLRRQRRVSQLELGLRAGVSQRHLSCIETGRSRPTRATLLALLDALEAPLAERNAALLAAGLAPQYSAHALDAPDLAPARQALQQLLHAPGAAPALVIDAEWNLLMANAGVQRLLQLLELPLPQPANLLDFLLGPSGLRERLINAEEVATEVLQRAQREALQLPALAARLQRLGLQMPAHAPPPAAPLLFTRLRSTAGELALFSMFTSFGAPLDVTLASLRIEHLFPADAATAHALQSGGMNLLDTLRIQAHANRLINHRLHAAMAGLNGAEFQAPRVGFFPSLAATLNHILGVDLYYVAAMEGDAAADRLWEAFVPAPTLAELAARQAEVDARLIAVALLEPAREIALPRGRHGIQRDSAAAVLMHLFMHQHHHRGQVHAMLSSTPLKPPQLDEFMMPSEAHFRVAEMAALGFDEAAVYAQKR